MLVAFYLGLPESFEINPVDCGPLDQQPRIPRENCALENQNKHVRHPM